MVFVQLMLNGIKLKVLLESKHKMLIDIPVGIDVRRGHTMLDHLGAVVCLARLQQCPQLM